MRTNVLLMPGINNSGPTHWQSLWEQADPGMSRIQVPDWDNPVCAEWVAAIGRAVRAVGESVVIVAHSLGCLPLAEWAAGHAGHIDHARVRGLMFVSVPDPEGPNFPTAARGFGLPPRRRLPFPGIVVSSEDDPYGAPAYARGCADSWGCRFVNAGRAGHINAGSGLGAWPVGQVLLRELRGG